MEERFTHAWGALRAPAATPTPERNPPDLLDRKGLPERFPSQPSNTVRSIAPFHVVTSAGGTPFIRTMCSGPQADTGPNLGDALSVRRVDHRGCGCRGRCLQGGGLRCPGRLSGTGRVPLKSPLTAAFSRRSFRRGFRLEADMPTMTVGNIQSFADADSIIAGGRADICMMARMHLLDPYWTRYAANELGYPLPCLIRTKPLRSARRDGCHLTRLTGPGTRPGRTYWGRSQLSSIGYVSRSSFRGR